MRKTLVTLIVGLVIGAALAVPITLITTHREENVYDVIEAYAREDVERTAEDCPGIFDFYRVTDIEIQGVNWETRTIRDGTNPIVTGKEVTAKVVVKVDKDGEERTFREYDVIAMKGSDDKKWQVMEEAPPPPSVPAPRPAGSVKNSDGTVKSPPDNPPLPPTPSPPPSVPRCHK